MATTEPALFLQKPPRVMGRDVVSNPFTGRSFNQETGEATLDDNRVLLERILQNSIETKQEMMAIYKEQAVANKALLNQIQILNKTLKAKYASDKAEERKVELNRRDTLKQSSSLTKALQNLAKGKSIKSATSSAGGKSGENVLLKGLLDTLFPGFSNIAQKGLEAIGGALKGVGQGLGLGSLLFGRSIGNLLKIAGKKIANSFLGLAGKIAFTTKNKKFGELLYKWFGGKGAFIEGGEKALSKVGTKVLGKGLAPNAFGKLLISMYEKGGFLKGAATGTVKALDFGGKALKVGGKIGSRALGSLISLFDIAGAFKYGKQKDWVGAGAKALSAALPWLGGAAGGALAGAGTFGAGAGLGAAGGAALGATGSALIDAWLSKRDRRLNRDDRMDTDWKATFMKLASDTIRLTGESLQPVLAQMKDFAKGSLDWIVNTATETAESLHTTWLQISGNAKDAWDDIINTTKSIWGGFNDWAHKTFPELFNVIGRFKSAIGSMVSTLKENILKLGGKIVENVEEWGGDKIDKVKEWGGNVAQKVGKAWNKAKSWWDNTRVTKEQAGTSQYDPNKKVTTPSTNPQTKKPTTTPPKAKSSQKSASTGSSQSNSTGVDNPILSSGSNISGSNNAQIIWNYLESKGLPPHAIAGIMGNLKAESNLEFGRLQGDMSSNRGASKAYTMGVNAGTTQFVKKSNIGYGLAQWTSGGRKAGLLNEAVKRGVSIDDPQLQLDYLWSELGSYGLINKLKNAKDTREASNIMLHQFERPANQGIGAQNTRASMGNKILELWKSDKLASAKIGDTMDMAYDAAKGVAKVGANWAQNASAGTPFESVVQGLLSFGHNIAEIMADSETRYSSQKDEIWNKYKKMGEQGSGAQQHITSAEVDEALQVAGQSAVGSTYGTKSMDPERWNTTTQLTFPAVDISSLSIMQLIMLQQ